MTSFDSRTWLIWGFSSMVPLLISRHPAIILQLICIVIAVRLICLSQATIKWRWIIRISMLFASIGVIFNSLTVRSGNQIAFDLPFLGWPVTWNAIAYGVVSGAAVITLVLTGVTMAAGLDWVGLTRVLPARMAPLAVSGSVAWSFLPGASQALEEIREAQAARGHRIRSGRDVLPIVVPLLDGSLNRALSMSEALEARGFGASLQNSDPKRGWSGLWNAMSILGFLMVAYGISLGHDFLLWPSVMVTVIGMIGVIRSPQRSLRPTRYREHTLTRADLVIIAASLTSLVAFLALASGNFAAITFNPYPNLTMPSIDFRLLLALAPLLTPAFYPASKVQI